MTDNPRYDKPLPAREPDDLLYWAWTLLCNVSEGDWTKQRDEWQHAVRNFRDKYHDYLDDYVALSDLVSEKAGRLVDEHRVIFHYAHPYQGAPPIGATVAGDTDAYRVLIQEDRVWCPCPAWKPDRYCSHAASVMVAWKEMQDGKEAADAEGVQ